MQEHETKNDIIRAFTDLINFLKNAFTTNIQAMILLQDQSVQMLNTFVEQGLMSRQDGDRLLHEWSSDSNRVAINFMKITEENFDQLVQHLQ